MDKYRDLKVDPPINVNVIKSIVKQVALRVLETPKGREKLNYIIGQYKKESLDIFKGLAPAVTELRVNCSPSQINSFMVGNIQRQVTGNIYAVCEAYIKQRDIVLSLIV